MLADLIGRNSVELPVAFDRDDLDIIDVDGMITAFPEQPEAVFLQMSNEITSFDRHVQPPREVVR